MRIESLDIPAVLLLTPVIFADHRGQFFEAYHQARYEEAGLPGSFVQDNQSSSSRGVLRGLHAQLARPQGKLVRVLTGAILDVAVDIRPDSPTFGRSVQAELSAENRLEIWVPPGFAHGFCVLSETADVLYKCTQLYDPTDEIGVIWNDPTLGIDWPIEAPVLSDKDLALPTLEQLRPRLESEAQQRR